MKTSYFKLLAFSCLLTVNTISITPALAFTQLADMSAMSSEDVDTPTNPNVNNPAVTNPTANNMGMNNSTNVNNPMPNSNSPGPAGSYNNQTNNQVPGQNGNQMPLQSNQLAPSGNQMPVQGNQMPVQGNQMPLSGSMAPGAHGK